VLIWSALPHVLAGDAGDASGAIFGGHNPIHPVSEQQATRPTVRHPAAPLAEGGISDIGGRRSPAAGPIGETSDLAGPSASPVNYALDGAAEKVATLAVPRTSPAVRGEKETAFLSHGEMRNLRDRVARRRSAHLAFLTKGRRTEVELNEPEHFIGWSTECDIKLPGSKWFFKGAAWITELPNGKHRIEPDNFVRAIEVRRKRVKSHILRDGDTVRIGGIEMRYHGAVAEPAT
jgi:hypothetical protein